MRKPNGIYNGVDAKGEPAIEKYISEDILEIAPYKENSFYFRKETQFFNGHGCGIYGIATRAAPNSYVFDDNEEDPRMHCQLQARISNSKIEFEDITPRDPSLEWQSACQSHCGARGVINDSWDRDKKRSIRYMLRLKKSVPYGAAIRSYEKKQPLNKAFEDEWRGEP